MNHNAFIGLDIHRKTVAWCAKDARGRTLGKRIVALPVRDVEEIGNMPPAEDQSVSGCYRILILDCNDAIEFLDGLALKTGRTEGAIRHRNGGSQLAKINLHLVALGQVTFVTEHLKILIGVGAAAQYRKTKTQEAEQKLLRRLQQIYRIFLSRAIKGFYLWFEDQETRDHVQTLLKG